MQPLLLSPAEKRALLDRFLHYAQIDTQSDESSTTRPSTEKQKDLARVLVAELHELGLHDARMAATGHVYASLPPNLPTTHPTSLPVPAIGFLAHLDTYHATPGTGVRPQVIEVYTGGDIVLPGTGDVIAIAKNPNLAKCIGHTLIHSDGTTLLGADDKAGIAEIMTMLAWLQDHPTFQHGKLCIAFTPDEEIGRGVDAFDLQAFGAHYAYTVDGEDLGEVQDETFSADAATLTIKGRDVHPGQAKGVMINAVRIAAAIIEALPNDFLPETTEGRQPYLHPHQMTGDVSHTQIKLLVRAFTESELESREDTLRTVIRHIEGRFPGARIELQIKPTYRNMGDRIATDPKVIEYAKEAMVRQGLKVLSKPIRGGTDGSRLTALGLLTPNLFAGTQAAHSLGEWVSLSWMSDAVGSCLQLVSVWVEKSKRM